jgi:hypothetical protein
MSPLCHAMLVVVFVVSCVPAWAGGAIHKCRGADGQSYYQATPCPATQRTEWVRDYPADPAASVASARPAPTTHTAEGGSRPRRESRARNPRRRGSSPQGAVISMHRDAVACERAKKARDQAYARLGLKRNFATSRKLDDRVNEACR